MKKDKNIQAEYFLNLYDKGAWDTLINDDGQYFGKLFSNPFESPFEITDCYGNIVSFQVSDREFMLEKYGNKYDLWEI